MAKFLDYDGLTYLWGKMKLSFQEKLVSGTTIKTINSESILGDGDIDVLSDASDVPDADIVTRFDSEAQLNSTDMTAQELYKFIQSLDVVPKEPFYVEIDDPTENASIAFVKAYAEVDDLEYVTVDPTKQVQAWHDPVIQYSYDGETWQSYTFGSALYIGDDKPGDKIYFRSDLFSVPVFFSESSINYVMFAKAELFGGDVKLGGDLASLNQLPAEMLEYAYVHLFSGCDTILNLPILSDYIVSDFGYAYMFKSCDGITEITELHATTVGESAYQGMFQDCANLATCEGVTLPAKIVAKNAYSYMFYDCVALTDPPAISMSSVGEAACRRMFSGCIALERTPILTAKQLADNCYEEMFNNCEAIVSTTALPATTLYPFCYRRMFAGCNALEIAPQLNATVMAESCYEGMFGSCWNMDTPPDLPARTLAKNCYKRMFRYAILTYAPELPATTLAEGCYAYMFEGCGDLTIPPALPAMTIPRESYRAMFKNAGLQRLPVLPATRLYKDCYMEMFGSIEGSPIATSTCIHYMRIPEAGDAVYVEQRPVGSYMFTNYDVDIMLNNHVNVYTPYRTMKDN